MAWTDEMVEELKKLWAEGVTTGEIGRRLNISKNSIVGKVHRLGLSGRPSPIKKKSDEPKVEKTVATAAKSPEKEKKAPKKTHVDKEISKEQIKKTPHEKKTETKFKPEQVSETFSQTNEEDDIKLAKSMNLPVSEKNKQGHLSLTELDNHTCRWPVGDPKDDNFHFCGKKVRLGQTYCEEHAAIAYVKPGKK